MSSSRRFRVYLDPYDDNLFIIQDAQWSAWIHLPRDLAENPAFDVADWYEGQLIRKLEFFICPDSPPMNKSDYTPDDDTGGSSAQADDSHMGTPCRNSANKTLARKTSMETHQWNGRNLQINGIQIPRGVYPAVQRNTAVTKDFMHMVPWPIMVTVKIDGHPARALLDSGSLGDFLSSTSADQLKVK